MTLPPDHDPRVLRALWLLEGRIVHVQQSEPGWRPKATRQPGWSRPPTVLRCPNCGNKAYSVTSQGFPWRRCDGPAGCGHEWNPEEVAGH